MKRRSFMSNSKIKNKNHGPHGMSTWTQTSLTQTQVAAATTSSPNLDHHLKQLGKLEAVYMMWWLWRSMMMMIIRFELLLIMVENFWWWSMMVIINFILVEFTVTVTGDVFQRAECIFFSNNQELAATVYHVASHTHRMVLQAFSVSGHHRRGGGHSLYLVILDEVVGLVVGLTSLRLLLAELVTALYLVIKDCL